MVIDIRKGLAQSGGQGGTRRGWEECSQSCWGAIFILLLCINYTSIKNVTPAPLKIKKKETPLKGWREELVLHPSSTYCQAIARHCIRTDKQENHGDWPPGTHKPPLGGETDAPGVALKVSGLRALGSRWHSQKREVSEGSQEGVLDLEEAELGLEGWVDFEKLEVKVEMDRNFVETQQGRQWKVGLQHPWARSPNPSPSLAVLLDSCVCWQKYSVRLHSLLCCSLFII